MTTPAPPPGGRARLRGLILVGLLVVAAVAVGVIADNRERSAARSHIVDLTLPAGSTLTGSSRQGEWDATEFWDLVLPFDEEVGAIRDQLPIGGDLQGLKWCLEDMDEEVGYVHWRWGDAREQKMIVVEVFKVFSPLQKHGGVNIRKTAGMPGPCATG